MKAAEHSKTVVFTPTELQLAGRPNQFQYKKIIYFKILKELQTDRRLRAAAAPLQVLGSLSQHEDLIMSLPEDIFISFSVTVITVKLLKQGGHFHFF